MTVVVVTGASGLIGFESAKFFGQKGYDVIGIDNDMRSYYFGPDSSTKGNKKLLLSDKTISYEHYDYDIRNDILISTLFRRLGDKVKIIIHAAAQPSHDWAASQPLVDFGVNAVGTVNLLESLRLYCPDAIFIFLSTNKVYGDSPNSIPLIEQDTRWEVDRSHKYFEHGIDESMTIDQSTHSIFGVSKVSADLMTQEYGKYFGLKTVAFRGGCLTGPAHKGAELHGFLSYLVKCIVEEKPYTIFGYGGKQVRDNIHAADLTAAFWEFCQNPRCGEVYNIGGSRHSNCSVLEAIKITEGIVGKKFKYEIGDTPRKGDHQWYISDVRKFQNHYPNWEYRYSLEKIIREIVETYDCN